MKKYKKEICNGCNLEVEVEREDSLGKWDTTTVKFDFCGEETTTAFIKPLTHGRKPLFENSVDGVTITTYGSFERLNLIEALEFVLGVLKQQD